MEDPATRVDNQTIEDVVTTQSREVILGFKQPDHDYPSTMVISGPGIGPSGMQPRPLELRKVMPKISRALEDCVSKARRFEMEQSASYVLYKQVEKQPEICPVIQVTQSQRQRIVNLMSRIYVAGIAVDASEDTVKLAFSPFGPIRRIDMSWDSATQNKGFAFVEYELPDSAELALDKMNDTTLAGRPIKVSRPCNAPGTTTMVESILDECRPYPRLFVSNVHPQVHSRDLRSVFEAFGKIRSCVILGERNPQHKGVAFVEYTEHKPAEDALISMNNFVIGGQALRVGRAVTLACYMPEDKGLPPAAALAMAAVSAKLQGKDKLPRAPQQSQLIKRDKGDSIIKRTPIDNLISAVVSPAMVQAGLSDLAANLINTTDINSIIDPTSSQSDHRRRLITSKDVRKLEKAAKEEAKEVAESVVENVEPEPKIEVPERRSRGRSKEKKRDTKDRRSSDRHTRRSSDRDRRRRSKDAHRRHRSRSRDRSPKKPRDILTLEDVSIKGSDARLQVMKKLVRNFKTDVILMRNLVSPKEVDKDLKRELELECTKYGKVKDVIINQEKKGELEDSETVVKIFVQFTETRYAERAHAALNKRYFAGKPIKAEYYDKEKFEQKDYSG
ncbi:Poly(U)-binding-splicing factor PUF60-B [Thelohanellus kitauei]|uniref:Poly(U)-binding-splicing factor PUF60-B n=1 Tax=Thelohanellus kitauei TaxID=669202 RepID=A0A0C2MRV5_THEKT|nr:Poly(U)-binding-splicing factor PUF60-B [Thelohanellus kitauei]